MTRPTPHSAGTILQAAKEALSLDIFPVPILPGTKRPPMVGWQKLRLTIDDINEHFSNGHHGVGWLLGIQPRPIADVDIDCKEGLAVATLIHGPKTDRVFGRKSAPGAHRLYELAEEFDMVKFEDPVIVEENQGAKTKRKPTLIELRGRGGQTVMPPTPHESGEMRQWERAGEFGKTTFTELRGWVAKIAAASLLVRYWPRGHETRHALSGMLARAGWTEETTAEFVRACMQVAQPDNSETPSDVRNTYTRIERGEEISGRPKLEQILGERGKIIVGRVCEWLQLRMSPPASAAAAPTKRAHANNRNHAAVLGEIEGVAWESHLVVTRYGEPKPILANAVTFLRNAVEWRGVLGFNEFAVGVEAVKAAPWPNAKLGKWTDHEDRLTADWLQHHEVVVTVEIAGQAVQVVAKDHPFHPVREYLKSLTWDGAPRTARWLTTYLSAEDSAYTNAIGERWLISAVARIFQPGSKADCCLILEGPQGILKSTALRKLFGDNWFTDSISELGSKDASLQTQGVWIIELGELDSMSRSEVSAIKVFMSRMVDRFRPPYGRRVIESPRQCVFAGSVNHSTYLRDETGGRRFWPVACGKEIGLAELEAARDQLWAEALVRYEHHAPWWLDSPELNQAAEQEQDDRYDADPWQELVADYIQDRQDVSIPQILEECIQKKKDQWTQLDKNRIGRCLRALKWERYRDRDGEKREWRFCQRSQG